MEMIACTCEDLPPHTHIPEHLNVRFPNGNTARITRDTYDLNPNADIEILSVVPPSMRVWVDWKEVAHELMKEENV